MASPQETALLRAAHDALFDLLAVREVPLCRTAMASIEVELRAVDIPESPNPTQLESWDPFVDHCITHRRVGDAMINTVWAFPNYTASLPRGANAMRDHEDRDAHDAFP